WPIVSKALPERGKHFELGLPVRPQADLDAGDSACKRRFEKRGMHVRIALTQEVAARVHRNSISKRRPEQRMDRLAYDFANDVPQRELDATDGLCNEPHGALAPAEPREHPLHQH